MKRLSEIASKMRDSDVPDSIKKNNCINRLSETFV